MQKTPNHREQVARRRAVVIGAMLGLAMTSGVIGALSTRSDPPQGSDARTGPFSYFPSE